MRKQKLDMKRFFYIGVLMCLIATGCQKEPVTIAVESITLNTTSITLTEGESAVIVATISPFNATNPKVVWETSNAAVATVDNGLVKSVSSGTVTVSVITEDSGKTATCEVKVKHKSSCPTGAVDLGLSVCWASCNLGASNPEEYGDYYAWGEVETYYQEGQAQLFPPVWKSRNCSGYLWASYKWCNGCFWDLTKYNNSLSSGCVDNRTVLDSSDDVAHVKLGGKWRMPTYEEFTELINKCSWTWTTINGIHGYKVTSMKIGYTDKWIFLPAAGNYYGTYLANVGLLGFYWSSSLLMDATINARSIFFHSQRMEILLGEERCSGLSVRPVYGDKVDVAGVSLYRTSLDLTVGDTYTFGVRVTPSDAVEKGLSWSSSNTNVVTVDQNGNMMTVNTGNATITVTTVDGGHTASCNVVVKTPGVIVPEAVDLGLSVKWASCNLGTTVPEGYSVYYQWAGLIGLTNASNDNCPYHTGSNEYTGWTKYIPSDKSSYWSGLGNPDNKTVLDACDDIAHVRLGDKWRIPTYKEFTELVNKCSWTWTTMNGIYGYKVTSTKTGYTDKWIFFPATFQRYYHVYNSERFYGYYLSSSLFTDAPCYAYGLYFDSDGFSSNHGVWRSDWYPIRPVSD